jgi:hypothetical protein
MGFKPLSNTPKLDDFFCAPLPILIGGIDYDALHRGCLRGSEIRVLQPRIVCNQVTNARFEPILSRSPTFIASTVFLGNPNPDQLFIDNYKRQSAVESFEFDIDIGEYVDIDIRMHQRVGNVKPFEHITEITPLFGIKERTRTLNLFRRLKNPKVSLHECAVTLSRQRSQMIVRTLGKEIAEDERRPATSPQRMLA